jgi:hypothetical protein
MVMMKMEQTDEKYTHTSIIHPQVAGTNWEKIYLGVKIVAN